MNITKFAVATLFSLAVLSTAATADAKKGQKIYLEKLKEACGMNGTKFAYKHTQDEWEAIKQVGKFADEVVKLCPKATGKLKPKYENDVYDFSYEYASDSGNIPSN